MSENKQTLTVEEQCHRFNRCVVDIFEFSKYVTIKDEATNQDVPFQWMPHNKYLIWCLLVYRQIVLLKTKQAWCSWTAAMFHNWKSYRKYNKILCLSRGEKEAAVLLDKSRFINANLPDWLKLKVSKDNNETLVFSDLGSEILALPSTQHAGAGYTATHVTRDELDFHDFAEENFGHIKPTIARGETSILDMSTATAAAQTHFKMEFRRARAGENNFKPLFFPYYVVPGRDAKWYLHEKRDYFPDWEFKKNYPRNIKEAIESVEGEGLFDASAIDNCLNDMGPPIEIRANATYIFRRPDPRLKYYAGGDGAEGRGGNNSVIFIMGTNGFDKELVAIMRTNNMTPDIFSFHAYQLLCEYGRPLLVMGADPWSQMVLKNLVMLGYRDKIYCSDKKQEKLGLIETEINKQQKLMKFALEVRNGLKIRDKQTIDEMSGWVLEGNKYVSTYSTDDCIIAGANALLAKELSPSSEYVTSDRF